MMSEVLNEELCDIYMNPRSGSLTLTEVMEIEFSMKFQVFFFFRH